MSPPMAVRRVSRVECRGARPPPGPGWSGASRGCAPRRTLSARPSSRGPAQPVSPGAAPVQSSAAAGRRSHHQVERRRAVLERSAGLRAAGDLADPHQDGGSRVERHRRASVPAGAGRCSLLAGGAGPGRSVHCGGCERRRLAPRELAGVGPRGGGPHRPGDHPADDDAAADRVRELRVAGGAGRLRLGPHQQVLGGLPGPSVLRRQPGNRRGRGRGP